MSNNATRCALARADTGTLQSTRSRRFKLISLIVASAVLPGCMTTFPYFYDAPPVENRIGPQPHYGDQYDDLASPVQAEQIAETEKDIAQISSPEKSAIMRFGSIEDGDPCKWATQENQACSAVELSTAPGLTNKSVTAEVLLKMVTGAGEDPAFFDADKAIDEIGRGRALSAAAQAVSADYLTGPDSEPPVTPDPELLPTDNLPEHP